MLALFCDTSQPPKTVRGSSIGDYVDWNCFSLPDCRREQLLTVARRGCFLGVRGRRATTKNFLEVGVGVLASYCRFRGVVKARSSTDLGPGIVKNRSKSWEIRLFVKWSSDLMRCTNE